jgi:hypothetical protein
MKSDNLFRHLAIPFAVAVVVYVIFYSWIENRRNRKGPWEVTFTTVSNAPALVINQPALAVTNLQITFPGATNSATNTSITFNQAHEVPYDMPYGKCVFMDPTFLPGTLVFDLFGHEIQLIPRVLTIDGKEMPWQSGKTIAVEGTNGVVRPPEGGTTNK